MREGRRYRKKHLLPGRAPPTSAQSLKAARAPFPRLRRPTGAHGRGRRKADRSPRSPARRGCARAPSHPPRPQQKGALTPPGSPTALPVSHGQRHRADDSTSAGSPTSPPPGPCPASMAGRGGQRERRLTRKSTRRWSPRCCHRAHAWSGGGAREA